MLLTSSQSLDLNACHSFPAVVVRLAIAGNFRLNTNCKPISSLQGLGYPSKPLRIKAIRCNDIANPCKAIIISKNPNRRPPRNPFAAVGIMTKYRY